MSGKRPSAAPDGESKRVWFSAASDPVTWDKAESMTVAEALAAGVPRSVIEQSWRDVDAQLGTNVADDLIRQHFGTLDPMCSYCEIYLSEHEEIHAQCVEEGA